jgi:hypothetical protein
MISQNLRKGKTVSSESVALSDETKGNDPRGNNNDRINAPHGREAMTRFRMQAAQERRCQPDQGLQRSPDFPESCIAPDHQIAVQYAAHIGV